MLRRSFFGSLAALPLLAVAGPKPPEPVKNTLRVVSDIRFENGELIVEYSTAEVKYEADGIATVLSFAECG